MEELTLEYAKARQDAAFQAELDDLLEHYVGRASPLYHAQRLSKRCGGAQIYLKRSSEECVSSRALFEMMLKALRYVGLEEAAESAEAYYKWRNALRRKLRVRHEGGAVTYWEKGWACEFASRSWNISRSVGRVVAGKIELEFLLGGEKTLWRGEVIEQLNRLVAEYGLADAVPVPR